MTSLRGVEIAVLVKGPDVPAGLAKPLAGTQVIYSRLVVCPFILSTTMIRRLSAQLQPTVRCMPLSMAFGNWGALAKLLSSTEPLMIIRRN